MNKRKARPRNDKFSRSDVEGAALYGSDKERIGSISHFHTRASLERIVVVVGGFLGIGSKLVSLPASEVDFSRDEDGNVSALTAWTKDELHRRPEHQALIDDC